MALAKNLYLIGEYPFHNRRGHVEEFSQAL
jgi:hypothetical protein